MHERKKEDRCWMNTQFIIIQKFQEKKKKKLRSILSHNWFPQSSLYRETRILFADAYIAQTLHHMHFWTHSFDIIYMHPFLYATASNAAAEFWKCETIHF